MRPLALLALAALAAPLAPDVAGQTDPEAARREALARTVTVVRDGYGVPHVYAETDAGAHFGMLYAQCEDAWWSVEERHVTALGRRAELYGEGEVLRDATVRALRLAERARRQYAEAPAGVRALLDAAADGVNHWTAWHPDRVRLLRRFEPWFFLVPETGWNFTGTDVRLTAGAAGLAPRPGPTGAAGRPVGSADAALADAGPADAAADRALGSNAWAVAPGRTADGRALLFLNPHWLLHGPSGRLEVHLDSREGLRFSGFAFVGNARVHAGHNGRLGFAHTVLPTDLHDVWRVSFGHPTDPLLYRHAGGWRRAEAWADSVAVRTDGGPAVWRRLALVRTHHGPVVQWETDTTALAWRHVRDETDGTEVEAFVEMARAETLAAWRAAVARRRFGGSNTAYADADGHIALVVGGAVPRRPPGVHPADTLDGSYPATEWQGLHAFDELPHLWDPPGGYVQNANATPYRATADGGGNPDSLAFVPYLAPRRDNARARNGRRILEGTDRWTLDAFARAAFDRHVYAARAGVPALVAEHARLARAEPARAGALAPLVDSLAAWDREADTLSVATTLFAVAHLHALVAARRAPADTLWRRVRALEAARDSLVAAWGTWAVPWGRVNRVQRVHPSYAEGFRDDRPSWAVPNTDGSLGTIANLYTTDERRVDLARGAPGREPPLSGRTAYGVAGNSYVGVVAFGERAEARSLLVFGQNEIPASPHHLDQVGLYARGAFKPAPFYADEVQAAAVRAYHPGGPDLARPLVPAWALARDGAPARP